MKELSIEEKAKAYDTAIERAKEKYAMYEGTKQGDVLEDVFHELKESKDEMIRNQIIEYIKWSYDEQECAEEEMHRWISWLEKQGEQKPNPCDGCINRKGCINCENGELREVEQKPANKIQLGKKYKCIASPRYSTFTIGKIYKPEDKFLCSLMNFCSDCFESIEDVEQKPALVEPRFKVGDKIISTISNIPYYITEVCNGHYLTDVGCIIMFNAQNNFKLVEQKPAWSEEDEKYLENAIMYCEWTRDKAPDEHCYNTATKSIDWLKSLKDKIQPKQEWSEQEQVRINRIVAYLENLNVADNDILLKDVDWLKSLKPQSRWKPSDEQMEAVKCAALDVSKFSLRSEQLRLENEPYYKALVSLYQDLKKLTE